MKNIFNAVALIVIGSGTMEVFNEKSILEYITTSHHINLKFI